MDIWNKWEYVPRETYHTKKSVKIKNMTVQIKFTRVKNANQERQRIQAVDKLTKILTDMGLQKFRDSSKQNGNEGFYLKIKTYEND